MVTELKPKCYTYLNPIALADPLDLLVVQVLILIVEALLITHELLTV